MVSKTIEYINTKIATLNLFNEILCLCEKITKGDTKFPAQPSGSEFVEIKLDKKDGVFYWRKTGDVKISRVPSESSCGVDYQFIVPLKAVGFLKRSKSNASEEIIIGAIIKEITTNNNSLRKDLKAKQVTVLCTSFKNNREELASEEYDGINFIPRYEYLYFSIEVELIVLTSNNCIPGICS